MTIWTVPEAARFLKLHRMTVYFLLRKGKLPATKVGGQWRFTKETLETWLSGQVRKRRRGK